MSDKKAAPIKSDERIEKDSGLDKRSAQERTMPASFYRSREAYELSLDKVFARSWQLLTDTKDAPPPDGMAPFTLLPGCLSEPLLLVNNAAGGLYTLSNVCTHRGAILVEEPRSCQSKSMRCRYHGRRFDLDGKYLSAPGFEHMGEADNFPAAQDHLAHLPMQQWGPFIFNSLAPAFSFKAWTGDMQERLSFLPLQKLERRDELTKDYVINANWALYVDNYLEGLHIPFVHPSLTAVLDLKNYSTELLPYGTLQLGVAAARGDSFDLPESSPDYGKAIGAYYYWLFPNLMLNFYPWGLSVNIINPEGHDRTRVRYLTYVMDESRMESYSPKAIEITEMEDEDVVQLVQKGIQSRVYRTGRYAPEWESGVRHFHQLLKGLMDS